MRRHSKYISPIIKRIGIYVTIVAFAGIVSCGDDDGRSIPDASVSDGALDGSNDAVIDGSPDIDNDEDGFPASEDCDDNDDSVYPGVTVECQSECDYGTITCLNTGEWSSCSADQDCDCETPGDTRLVDCGNCGEATQECGTDLKWDYPGECLNEGTCSPGEIETAPCEFTGEKHRLCGNNCEWLEWDDSDCSECAPGTFEITDVGCQELWEIKKRECNTVGSWETVVDCTADCILQPRSNTPDYKDEICIPGGPFIMGSDPYEGEDSERPEHTVILAPYFIDKYEVTHKRYRECVDAGICPVPSTSSAYMDPDRENYPHDVNEAERPDAPDTFCNWDGGRALPTEAQWEKAARGPSPREVPYPWGSDTPTCDLVVASGCHYLAPVQPVDSRPLGVSYYGIFQMAGNVSERCSDFYDPQYYFSSPVLDPTGPSNGTLRVLRGGNAFQYLEEYESGPIVTRRQTDGLTIGFRCARSVID
jgi:formylglycine-generating enzyme required for sulfatase activity